MVGLDRGEILCGLHEGMPMPSAGQEVVDAAGRMIWQPREDVGDVGLRVDVVEPDDIVPAQRRGRVGEAVIFPL